MSDSNSLDNLKSKITWENKTIYGTILILFGLIFYLLDSDYFTFFSAILLMIPAICLVIPDVHFKNARIFGFILIIFYIIFLIATISSLSISIYPISVCLAAVFIFLNIIAAYMMTVPTEKEGSNQITKNSNNSSKANYCKYCGTELDHDSNFCPSCGKEL